MRVFSFSSDRSDDVLQFGRYVDDHATRIGYVYAIMRRDALALTTLLEFKFFRGDHRAQFVSILEGLSHAEGGNLVEREDLAGFAEFDRDVYGSSERWGRRNVHLEWAFFDETLMFPASSGVSAPTPWHWV
jgi:hypothetical protein